MGQPPQRLHNGGKLNRTVEHLCMRRPRECFLFIATTLHIWLLLKVCEQLVHIHTKLPLLSTLYRCSRHAWSRLGSYLLVRQQRKLDGGIRGVRAKSRVFDAWRPKEFTCCKGKHTILDVQQTSKQDTRTVQVAGGHCSARQMAAHIIFL